jgi:glycogen synthase
MTADTVGGVWTYALELTKVLAQYGVRVSLVTMGRHLDYDQRAESRKLDNLIVFESDFKLEWMDDPWYDVQRSGEWLLELEGYLKPDAVHLNGYSHAAMPFHAPVVVVAHSCCISWWGAVRGLCATLPEKWSEYIRHVRAGLRHADYVVAPSRAMLDMLQRCYGYVPRARVIPNARHTELFTPTRKEQFIFSAGRLWDEAKNIAPLARIAPGLPTGWSVFVAGDTTPPHGTTPISLVNTYPLSRLSPQGIARWMNRAAIYALPARYEPFGLSVLEAAHAGCALVLGDIPSLRENWDGAALFVRPGDDAALLNALRTLADDSQLRTTYSERARERAAHFSPERMGNAYLTLYRELQHKTV